MKPLNFWKITERSSSSSSLPFLSVFSAALLHRRPSLAGKLPRCQLPLADLTSPPGPPTHPPTASPTSAGFLPPRHVVPPSPEAATSRHRSQAAAPARPCPFLAPPHAQEYSSTTFNRSRGHISLPRFLLRSTTVATAPPPSLLTVIRHLRSPTTTILCSISTAMFHRISLTRSSPSTRAHITRTPRRPFCPSPPLGLAVVPPLRLFLALTELTTSTTST
jgi:hypothetical protein